ncbi:hypothetical protein [Saccharopolyspora griseoalba]|uniref:Uncharacterized protein n=1 Tax=Saccharopolyspora griseoalba TaxID=1431848 RepID=A0ABW2LQM1_9PSEU
MYRALVYTTNIAGAIIGHFAGDFAAQTDWMAINKQKRTAKGRRALAAHGLAYGLAQGLCKAAALRAAGLRVPVRAQLAGQAAETLLHVLIDDGRLLRRFAYATGSGAFHELAPDCPSGGRALLDQGAHHWAQLPIGTTITAVLADRLMRPAA